jgi:hypothetical protein
MVGHCRHLSTSIIEGQMLTMRRSMRRFTRLTDGFSETLETMKAAISLHFTHDNFMRMHKRMTPAVAAGAGTSMWPLQDLVERTAAESSLNTTMISWRKARQRSYSPGWLCRVITASPVPRMTEALRMSKHVIFFGMFVVGALAFMPANAQTQSVQDGVCAQWRAKAVRQHDQTVYQSEPPRGCLQPGERVLVKATGLCFEDMLPTYTLLWQANPTSDEPARKVEKLMVGCQCKPGTTSGERGSCPPVVPGDKK